MKKTLVRGVAAAALAGAALTAGAVPALAADDNGGVAVVDEPDTSQLNNIYTFAPLGVPVLGLVRSINAAPGKILPSFGS
ncbi:hypothetical protein FPZ12_004760 [Amycolatopsis acidicola]|uniref:Secreted protein n=1 Tax=Amycolatopsis acidicola TaxID=2596893 RepID=A0A5N0VJF6_9PSEU|nr:hypothetical protein [Amycolatopsis acidicola]KAA9165798.1 hypothetical protein FPZ12_004760 [Amycolatopsis acidicola]